MEMNKKYSIVYLYIFRILKIIESFKSMKDCTVICTWDEKEKAHF